MAALPYIQLYVADYLADTMHLSTEEHGAYILLIFNYWQTGKPIPKKRLQSIARLPNDRWTVVEDSLNEFFNDTGTHWQHERIDADLAAVAEAQEQRSRAGKASAESRKRAKLTKTKREGNGRSTGVEASLQRSADENSTNKDTDKDKSVNSSLNSELTSAEPPVPVATPPPLIELPTNKSKTQGEAVPITQADVDEWENTFPAVDVMQDLRAMRAWLLANPTKAKTKSGMKRFVVSWLTRTQNNGGNQHERNQSRGHAAAGKREPDLYRQDYGNIEGVDGITEDDIFVAS